MRMTPTGEWTPGLFLRGLIALLALSAGASAIPDQRSTATLSTHLILDAAGKALLTHHLRGTVSAMSSESDAARIPGIFADNRFVQKGHGQLSAVQSDLYAYAGDYVHDGKTDKLAEYMANLFEDDSKFTHAGQILEILSVELSDQHQEAYQKKHAKKPVDHDAIHAQVMDDIDTIGDAIIDRMSNPSRKLAVRALVNERIEDQKASHMALKA